MSEIVFPLRSLEAQQLSRSSKRQETMVIVSIVLMILWLFLESAFAVSTVVSSAILTVAFALYAFDWWLHSRTLRTHNRPNSTWRRVA